MAENAIPASWRDEVRTHFVRACFGDTIHAWLEERARVTSRRNSGEVVRVIVELYYQEQARKAAKTSRRG